MEPKGTPIDYTRQTAIWLLAVLLAGCAATDTRVAPAASDAVETAAPTTLTVGLYPWVPRPAQFQSAITTIAVGS